MKNENLLSELYQRYAAGESAKKDLEGRVFRHLLRNYGRYRVFAGNRDLWEEFLSWFYPRLSRAIDLYRDMGSSFDAYINSLVHKASCEYRRREADHWIAEYACWKARAEETALRETEPDYGPDSDADCGSGAGCGLREKAVSLPKGINAKQVLLLLLKSCYFVSDELIECAARAMGVEVERVRSMVKELRELCSDHEAGILDLRERVHCQHYRCLVYERRMNDALPGTEYRERMKDRFERARKRFRSMQKRLGKIRMGPSNRAIAKVAGIPKGTVDSSLSAVKRRFRSRTHSGKAASRV